ncbi:DNA/RNA non-specific endonuclease [Nonomuraea solani]|uniref:DNA/RNA non-specific endonuclease n=1 Tax=Nonomuraea solani TaxID=1144553 RepID=UPI000CDE88E9|nr:DNA/RNA non-specific endonuclease [Nonomuraea solani]
MVGARTAYTRTFAHADGRQTTEFSSRPLHYQGPDAIWRPIDTRVVPAGGGAQAASGRGWRNAADAVDIRLAPRAGSGDVVRLALDADHEIAYGLLGAAPAAGRARRHSVRYPGVLTDTDLNVVVTAGGMKKTMVLRSPDAPGTFLFSLRTRNLTARMDGGRVLFTDEAGRTRAVVPATLMRDSATVPARSPGVSYELVTVGGAQALKVSADRAWLRAPSRKYPVMIDPPVEAATAGAGMSVGDDGSTGGGQILALGRRSAAYVAFPQLDEKLKYHRIFGASLWMVNYDSGTCRARPVTVHPVMQAWTAGSGYSYPGPGVGPALTRKSFSYGHIALGATRSKCPTKPVVFDLGTGGRDLIQRWVNGRQANYGLSARDASPDGLGSKKFTGHDTANPPRLFVTHSPYNATYALTNAVPNPPVTQAQSGKIKITVTNIGAETWTPATYYLGYRVYDAKGKLVIQRRSANLTQNVARNSKVKLDAEIKPLKPGTYSIDFTMVHTGGPVFTDHQVPPIRLILKIIDIPPVLQEVYPPNGYQAPTLTPQLWATAVDLDAPPGSALSYKFEVCEKTDSGGTTGCFDSGYVPTHAWTVPTGKLFWSKTYQWRVFVKDGTTEVPSPRVTLLTWVPQPELTSRVAGSPQGAQDNAFDPQTGNYSTDVVDAATSDLNVTRVYNSADPRRSTIFGAGWTTQFDMRVVPDQDGSGNVVVSYADGQQVRYGRNPDGGYAPPPGRQATLTADASGRWKLTDKSGTTYEFGSDKLSKITDANFQPLTLTYDLNGRVSKATSRPGGRSLTFTWSGAHVASLSTDSVDGKPLTWSYTYNGDLLSKVCAPDAACTVYDYTTGSHYRSAVLDSRPEAYYRLGEDEGVTAASEVAVNLGKDAGSHANVTLASPGALAGTGDTAASFNGTTSQVDLPPGTVKKTRDLAIELWFKNSVTGSGGPLVGYQDKPLGTTPGIGVPLLYVGTDGLLRGRFWSGGTITPITAPTPVNDGRWHHAVLSAMGSTQTLYLDGKTVGTLTGQTPNHITLTHNQIGAAAVAPTASWPGWGAQTRRSYAGVIDEVAIYQHPLGPDSVATHHREGLAAAGALAKVTLPSGKVAAEVGYDVQQDRVSEYTDADGGTWQLKRPVVYGGDTDLRRAVEVRDPSGYPYLYEYDALAGRIIRLGLPTGLTVTDPDQPPTPLPSATPTYVCTSPDPGDPSFCTTLPGNQGEAPDFIDHVLDGVTIRTFGYDDQGYLTTITNENGEPVKLTYDKRGNILTRTTCRADKNCQTVSYTYPPVSNPADPRNDLPTEVRDGRSTGTSDNRYRTVYSYTASGNLLLRTDPEGGQVRYAYTTGSEPAPGGGAMPGGLPLTMTDERGAVTKYSYFANGDLAQLTSPAGMVTHYTYDTLGRLTSETDVSDSVPAGAKTTYTYDALSRLTTTTRAATTNAVTGARQQQRVTAAYDPDGNVTAIRFADLASDAPPRAVAYDYDDHNRVERVIDAEGHENTYEYDVHGNLLATVDSQDNRFEYRYTSRGMIAEVRLRDFDGDPEGAPETGPYLVLNSYAYDHAGRLARETDAMGRTVTYAYYTDELLKSVTQKDVKSPDGSKHDRVMASYAYDGAGNPTEHVTDNGATVVANTYDATGRVASSTLDPGGLARRTTYRYDGAGNVTQVARSGKPSNVGWALPTAPETVDITYDGPGRAIKQSVSAGTTTLTSSYAYDQRGLTVATTDPRGNLPGADATAFTTTYGYDEIGRPIRMTGPPVAAESEGGPATTVRPQELTGYNAFDDTTELKDPLGNVTRTEYDRLGRPVKALSPSYTPPGSTTPVTPTIETRYDSLGNVVELIDSLGNSTMYTYDRLNRLQAEDRPATTNGERAEWRYTYARTGEVLSVTDPTGARSETTYDDLGRPITATQVERRPVARDLVTRYTYDDAGNTTKILSPSGLATTSVYDTVNQRIKTTDAAGVKTEYGYDALGRQVRITDGLNRTSKLTFDGFGRLATLADLSPSGAELRKREFVYDAVGNPTVTIDRECHKTTFAFDALNRLTEQIEEVSDTASITTTFGYDAAGFQSRYTDGRGNATTYTVNSLGLPESVIEPATAAHPAPADRTWTAGYDRAGNPISLLAPGGVSRRRVYDAAQRLVEETGSGASTSKRTLAYDLAGRLVAAGEDTYTYNDRGLILSAAGPSGQATMAYNDEGQLIQQTDVAGTSTFGYRGGRLDTLRDGITGASQTIGYDTAGMTSRVDYGGGRIRTFGYDDMSRMVSDNLKNAADDNVLSSTYGYDNCNRTTSKKTTGTAGAAQNSYTYDYAGRITSWTKDTTTSKYAWDDSGNLTAADGTTRTFDERNRLRTSGTSTYTYAPRGTLATVSGPNGTKNYESDALDRQTTAASSRYTYDSLNRPATRDGTPLRYAGTAQQPSADDTSRYTRSPAGDLLSFDKGGERRLALSDRRKDVIAAIAPDGSLTQPAGSAAYDPFGAMIAESGTMSNAGFHGDWTDPGTGHVRLGDNWYDPETAAFGRPEDQYPDPVPKSINANRYTYGHGAPIDMLDPSASAPCMCIGWLFGFLFIYPCVHIGPPAGEKYTPIDPNTGQPFRPPSDPGGPPGSGSPPRTGSPPRRPGPTPEELAAQARRRTEEARRRAEQQARRNPYRLDPDLSNPDYANPGDKITEDYKRPPRATKGTHNVIADTVRSLRLLHGNAVRDAGSVVTPISIPTATPPAHAIPVPLPSIGQLPPPGPAGVAQAGNGQDPRPIKIPVDIGDTFRYPIPGTNGDYPTSPATPRRDDDDDGCRPFKQYLPLDSAGRTTQARAQFCSAADLKGGSKALKSIHPSGWPTGPNGEFINPGNAFSRGHLIANQLGGNGRDPRNLFTIYQRMNNSAMKRYEYAVKNAVQKNHEQVYYEVRPVYLGHSRRPSGIYMYARGNKGLYFNVTIQNSRGQSMFPWQR